MFTVYSTNCPNCKVLLKKLALKDMQPGRDFILIDDVNQVNEVAAAHEIQSAPFLIDEEDKVYLFGDAMRFINELNKEGCASCKLN